MKFRLLLRMRGNGRVGSSDEDVGAVLRRDAVAIDVTEIVRIVLDQIGGRALEGDRGGIGGDRRPQRSTVRRAAAERFADAAREAGEIVVHEDVGAVFCRLAVEVVVARVVRVAGNEVSSEALEGNVAAVGRDADRARQRSAVGLLAVGGDAGARGGGAQPIAHEDVGHAVGVARDQVRRRAQESDEATVGRQRGRQ